MKRKEWKTKKIRKNLLTKARRRGKITKPNCIVREPEKRVLKEMKKISKKCLTNRKERARIANVPPRWRVPCKLNNVTKRKHQTGA